jgi:hypothetical protein
MKLQSLLSIALVFASVAGFAGTEYIACGTPREKTYNIAIEVIDGQIQKFSTVDSSLQSYDQVQIQSDFPLISIEYTEHLDTHYGYVIGMQTVIKGQFQIAQWTSGNDSDNYYPVQNSSPVSCHILKSKPASADVIESNIEQSL